MRSSHLRVLPLERERLLLLVEPRLVPQERRRASVLLLA